MFHIVDGSGLVFRAFFAIGNLVGNNNLPCNALFGFIKMLLGIIEHANNVVIVFDGKDKTFRQQKSPQYKAHRPPMDSNLVSQWPEIFKACDLLGVPFIIAQYYEADDLIASLVEHNRGEVKIKVISSDKDMMQLYQRDSVLIYDPMKNIYIDERVILDKFGVEVDKIIEVQALMGDASDGIAGVYGIGPKKAALLINQFGCVENLIKNYTAIANKKLQELIAINIDAISLAKDLVTLEKNVEQVKNFTYKDFYVNINKNIEAFIEYCKHWGFSKIIIQINKIIAKQKTVEPSVKIAPYIYSNNFINLSSLQLHFLHNNTLYIYDGEYMHIEPINGPTTEFLINTINNLMLHNNNLHIIIIDTMEGPLFNTYMGKVKLENLSVMLHLLHNFTYENKLDILDKFLNNTLNFTYNKIEDLVDFLWQLYNKGLTQLNRENLANLYYSVELPLLKILHSMTQTGIDIDILNFSKVYNAVTESENILRQKINICLGEVINLASPKQLGEVLFDKLNLPDASGNKSTNIKNLEPLRGKFEVIDYILEWRGVFKLKTTYLEGLFKNFVYDIRYNLSLDSLKLGLDDNLKNMYIRVQGIFSPFNTLTGRLVSYNPNLQNLPTDNKNGLQIRQIFVAESNFNNQTDRVAFNLQDNNIQDLDKKNNKENNHKNNRDSRVFLALDYSQIELRVLAKLVGVKALQQAFDRGEDVHLNTAKLIFKHVINENNQDMYRSRAKTINFGIIYGMGARALAQNLGVEVRDAQEYIQGYFTQYPEIFNYMEQIAIKAQQQGYVETILGRKCYINPNLPFAEAKRQAINAPIQGSAADIIKTAMVKITDHDLYKNFKMDLVLQIHDELVFNCYEPHINQIKAFVIPLMENIFNMNLKVNYTIGKTL